MENTLRRLVTKVGAKSIFPSIGETLRPVQFEVSFKGECVAASHAASRYQGEALHRWVLFKVDMTTAFNCLRRDVFLAVIDREREHRPCTDCCDKLTRGQLIFSMVIQTWCRKQVLSRGPLCGRLLLVGHWQYYSGTGSRVQRLTPGR